MQNLYSITVPIFVKTLGGLKNVLSKAREHGVDEEKLLKDSLAPDMFPFVRQIRIACDNAKGATARLAGVEIPKYEDNEKTIAELEERIDKTVEFIKGFDEKSFAGAESRQIVLPYFKEKYLTGFDYAREYAIPNFFFHVVTAYDLIRKNGVKIGKADYLNGLSLKDL